MAAFFKKPKYTSLPQVVARREIPEGLWVKCPSCAEANHKAQLEENLQICPRCGYHNRMTLMAWRQGRSACRHSRHWRKAVSNGPPQPVHQGAACGRKAGVQAWQRRVCPTGTPTRQARQMRGKARSCSKVRG